MSTARDNVEKLRNLPNDTTTVLVDDDIGVTVQAYDTNTAKTDMLQVFTKAQRSVQSNITWSAAITVDMSLSNGYYLDTTSATSNWTMSASNIGTDMQGGMLIIKVNATYTVDPLTGWSADFVNPATLSTTGTYDFIPFEVFNGKIYFNGLVNYA